VSFKQIGIELKKTFLYACNNNIIFIIFKDCTKQHSYSFLSYSLFSFSKLSNSDETNQLELLKSIKQLESTQKWKDEIIQEKKKRRSKTRSSKRV
jgi:hypothetical protein